MIRLSLRPSEVGRPQSFWSGAKSVTELGELTAQWLEETLLGSTRPYAETTDLVPTLASVNRAGYLTVNSQPGTKPTMGLRGKYWQQRAAVDGFIVSTRRIWSLINLCNQYELAIVVYPRAVRFPDTRCAVSTTASGDDVATVFGARWSRSEVRLCFDGVLHQELCRTPQVTVIDPMWGRNDRLWSCLDQWANG